MSNGRKSFDPNFYQIKIKGHLEKHWAEWFEEMTFTHEKDGTTTLSGPLPDQAALPEVFILMTKTKSNPNLLTITRIKKEKNR